MYWYSFEIGCDSCGGGCGVGGGTPLFIGIMYWYCLRLDMIVILMEVVVVVPPCWYYALVFV